MSIKELHKDTTQDRVKKYNDDYDIVRVPLISKSEIRYYMDYGDGYDKNIYDAILNNHEGYLYFLILTNPNHEGVIAPYDRLGVDRSLCFYVDKENVFINEGLKFSHSYLRISSLFKFEIFDFIDSVIELYMSLHKGKVFDFSIMKNTKIKPLVSLIMNRKGFDYIIEKLPINIKEIRLDQEKVRVRSISRLRLLKKIYGEINIQNINELHDMGVSVIKYDNI